MSFKDQQRHIHKRDAQVQMGLLDIFNKNKIKRPTIKGAGATLYPDKIVIETVDRIKDLYGVVSTNVTLLDSKVGSDVLGRTLRHHLEQSRDDLKKTIDTEGRYNDYLKAVGFKNRKEQYKNALHLIIHQDGDRISVAPTINGGPTGKNRGFGNTKDEPMTVDISITDEELGNTLRLGWSKCVCNYA
ncbi:MAG TPA: contact-dependent growth inhibition system immunity protein [Chryseolinea sp.]|nr:contact-dependent growth inhibition system immunity protein [Chryseolinea sp.]